MPAPQMCPTGERRSSSCSPGEMTCFPTGDGDNPRTERISDVSLGRVLSDIHHQLSDDTTSGDGGPKRYLWVTPRSLQEVKDCFKGKKTHLKHSHMDSPSAKGEISNDAQLDRMDLEEQFVNYAGEILEFFSPADLRSAVTDRYWGAVYILIKVSTIVLEC